jgi:hypothetical protein
VRSMVRQTFIAPAGSCASAPRDTPMAASDEKSVAARTASIYRCLSRSGFMDNPRYPSALCSNHSRY